MARAGIDLTDSQLRLHQANERFGTMYSHFALTSRWAPGEFVMADGTRLRGNLARNQVLLGGGWGDTEEGMFFLGAHIDQLAAVGRPGQDKQSDADRFKPGGVAQMLYYLGGSVAGVQASAGILLNEMGAEQLSLDGYGNFAAERSNSPRPGSPPEVQDPSRRHNPPNSALFTLYDGHTGAYLAITYGDQEQRLMTESWTGNRTYRTERVGSGIQDLRFNLQPLRHYLPAGFGLPFATIARYDRPLTELSPSPQEQVAHKTTDFALGADDVLQGGVRWRAVINQDGRLRIAELGYVEEFRIGRFGLLFGARAMAVNRTGSYEPSGEGFLKASLLRKRPDVEGRATPTWFGLSGSYSYNTPDSTTFIPIPKAHVVGVQLVYGPTEVTKPLIPLVRAVDGRSSREED
ncbi:MAG: hypothetical protein HY898_29905 [Deltaproteobacteria bacterium]|nr:hypothetical protein [Deltaproteobacteria bacterium]